MSRVYPDAGKTFTEAEKAERTRRCREEQARNAEVWVSGWRCHCGIWNVIDPDYWLAIGDSLDLTCGLGHLIMLRFIPEGVTR